MGFAVLNRCPIWLFPPQRRVGTAAATALVSTVLAFSPGCSSGSGGGGPSGPIGEVRVLNETSAAGAAVVSVVLPLHQGAYRRVPRVRTETLGVCQVSALGAKWADGSLRTVRVDLPVDAAANSIETLTLQETSGADPAFVMHPAVKKALPAMGRGFEVNKTTNSFETSYLIEDGPLVQVFRAGTRAKNSMMWAELDILYYANMPHARFVLTWGNSDPSNQALYENPGEVWFQINGPKVIVDGAAGKVLQRSEVGGLTRLKLYAGGAPAWKPNGSKTGILTGRPLRLQISSTRPTHQIVGC